MGSTSGIKWNGVSIGTQSTLDVIGADVQLILRDPKTQQEWVTTSQDYAGFLMDNGLISGSKWTEASGDLYPTTIANNVGIGTTSPAGKLEVVKDALTLVVTDSFAPAANTPQATMYYSAGAVFVATGVGAGATGYNSYMKSLNGGTGKLCQVEVDETLFAHAFYSNSIGTPSTDYHGWRVDSAGMTFFGNTNGGTNPINVWKNGSNNEVARVNYQGKMSLNTTNAPSLLNVQGDVEVLGSANGIILVSPDATRYRVTVANGGTLTVTAV